MYLLLFPAISCLDKAIELRATLETKPFLAQLSGVMMMKIYVPAALHHPNPLLPSSGLSLLEDHCVQQTLAQILYL